MKIGDTKMKSEFGEYLKSKRMAKGWSVNKLADVSGVSAPQISRIETGNRGVPKPETLQKLSNALGVPYREMFAKGYPEYEETSEWLKFKEANNVEELADEDYIKVPILGEVKAGYNLFAEENIIGYNYVPKSEMNGGDYFYLKVKGNSMINIGIQEGFLVKVKKQNYIDENGKIGLVLIDDMEGTIKRIYRTGDKVILQAENDDIPPEAYDPDQIKILGQVVKAEINL